MIRTGTNIITNIKTGSNLIKFTSVGSTHTYPDGALYNPNTATETVRFGSNVQKAFRSTNNPIHKWVSDFVYTYVNEKTLYLNGFTVIKGGYYTVNYKTKLRLLSGAYDPGAVVSMGVYRPTFNVEGSLISANPIYETGSESIIRGGGWVSFDIDNYLIYCNANDVIVFGGTSPLDNIYMEEQGAYANLIYKRS